MANVAFIFHGKIENRSKIFLNLKETFGAAHQLTSYVTKSVGHSIVLAEQAVREGSTHVICVGGDGSLNEVANGLMNVKKTQSSEGFRKVRLGVLPMGTGNDFVKSVSVPKHAEGLKRVIEADSYKTIDLGLVEFKNKFGEEQKRYFVNITDIGMGGVVAQRLSGYSKWMGSTLTYQRAILTTLLTYKHQPVIAKADSFSFEGKIMNLIIANGKYFGSGLGIAPDAITDDGVFSIVILGEISFLDYIKNLGSVRNCQRVSHPELHYKTAKEMSIFSQSGPLPIDMDGEFIGFSPMKVTVTHQAIKFLTGE